MCIGGGAGGQCGWGWPAVVRATGDAAIAAADAARCTGPLRLVLTVVPCCTRVLCRSVFVFYLHRVLCPAARGTIVLVLCSIYVTSSLQCAARGFGIYYGGMDLLGACCC
ncbi:hypothetical protein GUJ93_ZPchr0004g39028 [Zizania palustris]|uniref:Uncharacterized protein n=1 Tax=Zizania palustris TaxID=103762 RepID=A0A8J5V9A4_ZIZPA|nr:hypothetical protein GUJ93_ZPchr0004g39028 [Zizania palustris]